MSKKPDLHSLFNPAHVVVIGASRSPGKSGNRTAVNLINGGFEGRISLVNPSGGELAGHPIHRSIADIEGPIDCAMAVVPGETVIDVARECARKKVRNLIVGATGFAELGNEEGIARQAELEAIASEAGMTIIGPNTNGLMNAHRKLYLGYNTSHGEFSTPGPVSVISHSGALMNHMIRRAEEFGVNVSKFLPLGNEAGVTMLDGLEYLIDDDETQVIGLIIEAFSDGARFRSLAVKAQEAGKSIVALKLGRSRAGAESSLAHSSRLAGNARAYDALFRSCAVGSVPSIEALAGACALIAKWKPKSFDPDRRLVCISSSGAGASLLADYAERSSMMLAGDEQGNWTGETRKKIDQIPTPAQVRNPIDTGSVGPPRKLQELLDALVDTGHSGPAIFFTHFFQVPGATEGRADAFIHYRKRTGSACAIVTPGGLGDDIEQLYRSNDIAVFRDIATCFDAMTAHFATSSKADRIGIESPNTKQQSDVQKLVESFAGRSGNLDEAESAQFLRAIGISVAETNFVTSAEDAAKFWRACGQSIVLKALPPGVAHKHKLGLVRTGLGSEHDITEAMNDIHAQLRNNGFEPASIKHIMQPMVRSGLEIIVGLTQETGLGAFLLVGLGGVHTELLDEIVLLPVPSSRQTIFECLGDSRLGRIIEASSRPEGVNHCVDAAMKLQELWLSSSGLIQAIDVNPLVLTDECAVAVDALVVMN